MNFLVRFFISGWVFLTTNCYFDPWYIMYIYAIYRNIMHILCKNYYLYMQKYANENWAHVKILIWETAAVTTSSDINFPAGDKNSISSNSYNCFDQCFKQNEHVKKVSDRYKDYKNDHFSLPLIQTFFSVSKKLSNECTSPRSTCYQNFFWTSSIFLFDI